MSYCQHQIKLSTYGMLIKTYPQGGGYNILITYGGPLPVWHGGIPPPPPPVSPLIYDKMTEIGGTIPSVNQKKFLVKIEVF